MPTQRFLHLPEEKRQRVLDAALNELARVPYDEVSINRIVRAAGISRGSFYQYFEDKKDLVEYLLQGFGSEMRAFVSEALQKSGGDVFAVFSRVLSRIVRLAEDGTYNQVFHNVFACGRMNEQNSFAFSRFDAKETLAAFGQMVDFTAFRRQDAQFRLDTVEMLIALMRQMTVQAFSGTGPLHLVEEAFRRKLDILQHGILAEGDGA